MQCPACGYPCDQSELTEKVDEHLRRTANRAGFLGAMPFGFPLPFLAYQLSEPSWPNLKTVGVALICVLPLAPLLLSLARIDRHGWLRVLSVVIPGLVVGACTLPVFYFAGLILVPAGLLSLVFGLKTIGPCCLRRDASGRALAILGMTPTISFLHCWTVESWLTKHTPEHALPLTVLSLVALVSGIILATKQKWNRDLGCGKPVPMNWDLHERSID